MASLSSFCRPLVVVCALLFSSLVFACATCGLSRAFNLQSFLISLSFVVLPFSLVGYIAWRLVRDARSK